MRNENSKFRLPEAEEEILAFWEKNKIFQKTLEKKSGKSRPRGKDFVFYEGPPTANAAPGIHHVEARVFKDIIPRYKTMRGYHVPRKAGWDTHGLPVEIQIEKELGFRAKRDIEQYGIAEFNAKAKESVWRHKQEFENLTRRIAFWLDMEHPYITYEASYMESLWWIIKEFWRKGLLYQDLKSVPWCPRCGTGLSSHEVGLGYKKVKDASVYVKLKIKGRKGEYLLVWTTTPWTLPANVAVAVNPKIEYAKYKIGKEYIWSAFTPPHEKDEQAEVVEKVSGKALVGLEYDAIYRVSLEYSSSQPPPYKVFPANFVSTDDGTGMVHIASAFGEEDLNLMKSAYVNGEYPLLQTVNPDGTMKKGIIAEGKFVKDADSEIIDDLKKRNLLVKEEAYEHEYPFCWRCATPLLYYAREAWWVRVGAVKDRLLKNNEAINWIPNHFKHGRFGEFLKEARDWAFSRERYWGTPLPIWKCGSCTEVEVIGSRQELAERLGGPRNKYLIMRHGHALTNEKRIVSHSPSEKYGLTPKGRKQVEAAAKKLKNRNIDLVFSSDILRAKETAEIIGTHIGVKPLFDARLREINAGIFEGKKPEEYHAFFTSRIAKFSINPPDGENLSQLRKRMLDFFREVESKYSGKTVLVVSHEYPLWMLVSGTRGLTNEEALMLNSGGKFVFINNAEVRALDPAMISVDEGGEVNLHRPYVDEAEFSCKKCTGIMRRVPEVADVWFDSGAMPFAQARYPFAFDQRQKSKLPKARLATGAKSQKLLFPADYICEAVDQTRGWFYTLLAVATLLGKGAPYKNVISLGHVLDKNGQKMSKSKGNVVDAWEMIGKYGADTLRWYFFTINAPADPKKFDEKDLGQKMRSFLMIFWNSFVLFDTYVDKVKKQKSKVKSTNILDKWILVKLELLKAEVTKRLDAYDVTGAGRAIEGFVVEDFSQWFLRRSRRRLQRPESVEEKNEAAAVTAHVLLALSKLLAPFIPFTSEFVYQKLKKKMGLKEISVHLAEWPLPESEIKRRGTGIIKEMEEVRRTVAEGLRLRAEAGIKVRQPLQELKIKNYELRKRKDLLELIKDEVNVKEISFGEKFELDTVISPELKEEGAIREFVRNIQEMRRDLGLKPQHKIRCQIVGGGGFEDAVSRRARLIKKDINAGELVVGGKKVFKTERELDLGDFAFWVGISPY